MRTHVLTRWLRLWRWLVAHPWLLLALFGVVLLLLGLVSLLADALPTAYRRGVTDPLGLSVQRRATPALEAGMLVVSWLGSPWGVVPLGFAIVVGLGVRRRTADGLFFRLAVGGAALLMQVAKLAFSREPLTFWPSLAPEPSFRFPSVHTLGSMAVVAAVVVLVWPTRWRAAALGVGGLFTLLVGVARVYLGEQYPSDVLAGWAAALAWVLGLSTILYGRLGKPASAPPDAPPTPVPHAIVAPEPGAARTERDPR